MHESIELRQLNTGMNLNESIQALLSIFLYQVVVGILLFILSRTIISIFEVYGIKVNSIDSYMSLFMEVAAYILFIKKYVNTKKFYLKITWKIDLKIYIFILMAFIGYRICYDNTLSLLLSAINKSSWVEQALNEMLKVPALAAISILFVAPIFEEAIFRGIILEQLSKRYTPMLSIIVSSALFSFFHLNLIQFVNVFFLGVLSGIVYLKTNSLIPCIFLHFINNGYAFMIGVLPWIYSDKFSITRLIIGILVLILSVFVFKNVTQNKENITIGIYELGQCR
ncbi:CPBP family intramembrane glutamic endopeptidase [Clostridium sp. DJ247]|uniref:CPBP family intramembrane glutamic endopeptidase n=1 Tax=Clostridium sp. DJ247 TaxID=2726188 RepID=UPI00162978B1|nr:type II CAAX endopeptidase family protein [Clostridium sp. DJ247]MBC2582819.1 CPBP family intramembrane metalloprotease [Clostridium sp. DJ247]